MKKAIVSLINVCLGLYLAGFYVYIFYWLVDGQSVDEPNTRFAIIELLVSIGVATWFLAQLSARFRHAAKEFGNQWRLKHGGRG